MPSKSKAQHNFMAAVANNPAFAKKVGVPSSVGKEFIKADKGRKFGSGGGKSRPDLQKVNRADTKHGGMEFFKKGGEMKESKAMMKKEVSFMKKKGAPKSMIKHEESEMKGMKRGGYAKKMADGGMSTMGRRTMATLNSPSITRPSTVRPSVKGMMRPMMMKKGGMAASKMGAVRTAAPSRDGIASKGKTKGKMITMRKGGRAC